MNNDNENDNDDGHDKDHKDIGDFERGERPEWEEDVRIKSMKKMQNHYLDLSSKNVIGCSKKKCKGFLLITPAMEHTERQTRYHLIELNLTDIVVYDF